MKSRRMLTRAGFGRPSVFATLPDKEQNVVGGETSPGEHFDGEEVGARQDGHVGGNEILPGSILAPLGRRCDPGAAKDISDCLIRDGMAEIGESSDNPSYPQPEFSLAIET